jgi:hypothetical protein
VKARRWSRHLPLSFSFAQQAQSLPQQSLFSITGSFIVARH